MRTVHEMSELTMVSVRTLHHYDEIGLLKPTKVTEAGYRLYDDAAVSRLQTILLFRELQFPLKEIKKILAQPNFDAQRAVDDQIQLLELQKERLERLIELARERKKGVNMDFSAFDKSKLDAYAAEAKEKWGNTDAYREFEKKGKSTAENNAAGDALMRILADIGGDRALAPDAQAVQEKVKAVQKHITKNFYPCTKEILASLGQMYTQDERFRANIDAFGGAGTAEFVSRAIEAYCKG